MKLLRSISIYLLIAALILSPALGEGRARDITRLMNAEDIPEVAEITKASMLDGEKHDIACAINAGGKSYGCEFSFVASGFAIVDWREVQNWLGDIILYAATNVGANTQALAQKIDETITSSVRNASADENGDLPAWADGSIELTTLRVSTPFFPKLSIDKNNSATQRLQQTLVRYGFLNDNADGYFGARTKEAVKELQTYVRELEAEAGKVGYITEIASISASAATEELPEGQDALADDALVEDTRTQVNGVADALLQSYLFSDRFVVIRNALKSGMSGVDVRRLQRRLNYLGCSADEVDGKYGAGTVRGVQIFQHYNGLDETGRADVATLQALYSDDAKRPDSPIMTIDSRGREVTALQTRLRELGFTNAAADGIYGESTKEAVKALQQYMIECGEPNIVVNGAADPILLNDFFDPAFPAFPDRIGSGDKGTNVLRVQRRLSGLNFFEGTIDGDYGAKTAEAVKHFQRQHRLEQTGTCNKATCEKLFSSSASKALKPYVVRVSIADQRVYVYGLDENNEYTDLVRTMKCSTGKDGATATPKGTYEATTGPGARWHYFTKFNCWAQYAYYIQGDIMFHSVLFNTKEGAVTKSSVNNLGRKASHGCVRLSVEDAEWIWRNCPKTTKVIVE